MPTLTLAKFIASNMIFQSEHNFGYMKPVFERAFIEKHRLRFDETLRIGEDYIFLASALARGGLCVVEPTVGYLYYIRDGSISRVLRQDHVEAMLAADTRFFAEHPFGAAALAAQRRRTRNLKDVIAFLKLVDSIKERELQAVLKIACLNLRAVRHLSMPIFARFRRLAASLRSGRQPSPTSQLSSPCPTWAQALTLTKDRAMDPKRRVRKAVIPVAGNGTRFLPATKAMPKEMLTIVDRPVVQYAVDEAIEAGIEHIVFVTSRNKSAIEDHFDDTPELISSLQRAGKSHQSASWNASCRGRALSASPASRLRSASATLSGVPAI